MSNQKFDGPAFVNPNHTSFGLKNNNFYQTPQILNNNIDQSSKNKTQEQANSNADKAKKIRGGWDDDEDVKDKKIQKKETPSFFNKYSTEARASENSNTINGNSETRKEFIVYKPNNSQTQWEHDNSKKIWEASKSHDYEIKVINDFLKPSGLTLKPSESQIKEFAKKIQNYDSNILMKILDEKLNNADYSPEGLKILLEVKEEKNNKSNTSAISSASSKGSEVKVDNKKFDFIKKKTSEADQNSQNSNTSDNTKAVEDLFGGLKVKAQKEDKHSKFSFIKPKTNKASESTVEPVVDLLDTRPEPVNRNDTNTAVFTDIFSNLPANNVTSEHCKLVPDIHANGIYNTATIGNNSNPNFSMNSLSFNDNSTQMNNILFNNSPVKQRDLYTKQSPSKPAYDSPNFDLIFKAHETNNLQEQVKKPNTEDTKKSDKFDFISDLLKPK